MASTIIHNPSIEPVTMPFPFKGVLAGGQSIKFNVAIATVIAAFGGSAAVGPLQLSDAPDGGPYNTEYLGGVSQALAVPGDLTAVGDLAAAGGFRAEVGPFTAPGAAGVTAAGQTNLDMRYSHTVTAAAALMSFVAKRPGSIIGLSAAIDIAITGAGTSIVVSVVKNGTEVALTVTLTQAGGELKGFATAAKDLLTFVAGDTIGVSYTSTAISNTPALVASVEIEC